MIIQTIPSTEANLAEIELKNPETTAKRVQELFVKWWPNRKSNYGGYASREGDVYLLSVWSNRLFSIESFLPPITILHFPKVKLTGEQIALLETAIQQQNGNESC